MFVQHGEEAGAQREGLKTMLEEVEFFFFYYFVACSWSILFFCKKNLLLLILNINPAWAGWVPHWFRSRPSRTTWGPLWTSPYQINATKATTRHVALPYYCQQLCVCCRFQYLEEQCSSPRTTMPRMRCRFSGYYRLRGSIGYFFTPKQSSKVSFSLSMKKNISVAIKFSLAVYWPRYLT